MTLKTPKQRNGTIKKEIGSRNIFAGSSNKYIFEIWKARYLYLFLLPGMIFLLVFRYLPMYGIQIAFRDFNLMRAINEGQLRGFYYFEQFFKSPVFWQLVKNTVILSFLKLVFLTPAAILLAILLNEVKNILFKRVIQTVSYFPFFLSWVIISVFTYNMLGTDYGMVQNILTSLGVDKWPIYLIPDVWRGMLTGLHVWKSVGYSTIIYLAAISTINPELYECAFIDGAGRFRRIWYITLPQIVPVIVVLLILSSASLINGDFEQIFAFVGNPVDNPLRQHVEVLDTYIYKISLQQGNQYSYAAAIGIFRGVIGAILVYATNKAATVMQDDEKFRLF